MDSVAIQALKRENEALARELNRLRTAVHSVYYSAVWHPDRPLHNEQAIWTELRDAAGFKPGQSPKEAK